MLRMAGDPWPIVCLSIKVIAQLRLIYNDEIHFCFCIVRQPVPTMANMIHENPKYLRKLSVPNFTTVSYNIPTVAKLPKIMWKLTVNLVFFPNTFKI